MQTNYKCKNCGKSFGVHRAKYFNCPLPGRGKWVSFNIHKVYEPNLDKPEPEPLFTL